MPCSRAAAGLTNVTAGSLASAGMADGGATSTASPSAMAPAHVRIRQDVSSRDNFVLSASGDRASQAIKSGSSRHQAPLSTSLRAPHSGHLFGTATRRATRSNRTSRHDPAHALDPAFQCGTEMTVSALCGSKVAHRSHIVAPRQHMVNDSRTNWIRGVFEGNNGA